MSRFLFNHMNRDSRRADRRRSSVQKNRPRLRPTLKGIERLEDRRLMTVTPVLVDDLSPGSASSAPNLWHTNAAEFAGELYFVAQNSDTGSELFATDGTAGGTRLVFDALPGTASGSPRDLQVAGDSLLFFAQVSGAATTGLYAYDGTSTNLLLSDVTCGGDSRTFGDQVLFRVGCSNPELWSSDGTAAGTRKAFDAGTYFRGQVGDYLYLIRDGENLHTNGSFKASDQLRNLTTQSDGKILAVGRGADGVAVSRYTSDGSIDLSFGTDGRAELDLLRSANGSATYINPTDPALQDKIVIVGPIVDGTAGQQMAVVRLNADGTPDPTFGNNGLVAYNFGYEFTEAFGVAIQEDDRIVLFGDAGEVFPTTVEDFAIARLNSNGSIDDSFGTDRDSDGTRDGVTRTAIFGQAAALTGIILKSPANQGKLVAAGLTDNIDGFTDFAVLRYNPDGSLDTGFGLGGIVTIPGAGGEIWDIQELPDGSLILAGATDDVHVHVVKLDVNGNLLNGFGTYGQTSIDLGNSSQALGMSIDSDGRLLVAASTMGAGLSGTAKLFRLNADGSFDLTFGTSGTGVVSTDYSGSAATGGDVIVTPNGIVFAGTAYFGDFADADFGLARFDTNGALDTMFGSQGMVTTGFGLRSFDRELAGTGITNPNYQFEFDGRLVLTAQDAADGRHKVWSTDGTPSGTEVIGDHGYVVAGEHALFVIVTSGSGLQVWKSDGTAAGTILIPQTLSISDPYGPSFAAVGDLLYVGGANSNSTRRELWLVDDGVQATKIFESDELGPYYPDFSMLLTAVGNTVLFHAPPQGEPNKPPVLWQVEANGPAQQQNPPIQLGYIVSSAAGTFTTKSTDKFGRELYRLLDDADPASHPSVTIPAGNSGTINIERDGDDLIVKQGDFEYARLPLGSIAGIEIQGDSSSENFAVNIDSLSPEQLPDGIYIHAGANATDSDRDVLIMSGTQLVTNYDYTTGGKESGTLTVDGFTVTFEEFEPIIDQLSVTNRTFQIGTAGNQTIVLSREGDGSSGRTLLSDGGSGTFESIAFMPPQASLDIDAGDGDDLIVIEELDNFTATLSITAGDGNDSVDASRSGTAVTIDGGAGDDVLIGSTAADVIVGGDGNDTIDAGAGADAVDGGGGLNDITADADDGALSINVDEVLTLASIFSNPSSATIDWGDGTIVSASVNFSTGQVSGEHAYTEVGFFSVVISVLDSNNQQVIKELSVAVSPLIAGYGEVLVSTTGVIRVGGTVGDDNILVQPDLSGQQVEVVLNGAIVRSGIPVADISDIRIWGHDGNDHLEVRDLAIVSLIDGGAGDDQLVGGDAENVMLGGYGSDHLIGGSGNDFLIGGFEADRIVGGSGHDILIADEFGANNSIRSLRGILAEWVSDKSQDTETSDATEGDSATGDSDRLTGGSGTDWFVVGVNDFISDLKKNKKDNDVVTYI